MERRRRAERIRRLALLLRYAGLACVALSFVAALSAPQARAAIAAPFIAPFLRVAAALSPSATPAPSVSPSPTPAPKAARGGPLRFTLTGGLTVGRTQMDSTRSSGDNLSAGQTTENAGLLARLERDTATSRLVLSVPAGLSFQHSTFGVPQLAYYNSTYGLAYGPQPLSLLGGVPLGSTLDGLSLILPIRGGDLTFYEGPALGADNETFRLRGVLARSVVKGALVEAGVTRASAAGVRPIESLVLGAAHTGGLLSQSIEGSIQQQGTGKSYGYQYLANIGGSALSTTLTVRRIGSGFVDFGGGVMQAENFGDLSLHDTLGAFGLNLDESLENTSSESSNTATRRGELYLSRSFKNGLSTAFTFSDQRQSSVLGAQWQGGPGFQASFSFFGSQAVIGGQWLRSTAQFSAPSDVTTYNAELAREFGKYNASLSYESNRQTGIAPQSQSESALSFGRVFGPMSISVNTQLNHVSSPASNAVQFAPTLSVARQISPSLSLGFTYGEQFTHDSVNPLSNGRSRIFSVQVAAPFALGNGAVQGRVNPHLPATISGTVVNESVGSQFTFGAGVSNGVPNVAVVLDNQTVARTDLSGHFQFNFVTPGVHQVRLESSSLPRGVLVDQPYVSITVFGGQQASLAFVVGNFGVIEGQVFGVDGSGAQIPLDNVAVRLDGVQIAQTDPYGAFGFGRLQPGDHTLELVTSSLPATVGFSAADSKKRVTVQNGRISKVQFVASPLGSISGKVVYDPSLAPDYTGGAYNAYVVAEPGDYAVIANDDGSYYMDNLPAGTYTLDVDPETIPPDTANAAGPISVTVDAGGHKDGVDFTLTHKQKAVVFTFKSAGGNSGVASLTLSDSVLPPLGATQAVVDPSETAKTVVVRAFGLTQPLHYDSRSKVWIGMIDVPAKVQAGPATLVADVDGAQHTTASATLTIDPQAPAARFTLIPAHPHVGENVVVRARFLADVLPGDTIHWIDGQLTHLSRHLAGRVYEFTVKISEQPMRGFLLTKQGQVPITLR